MNKRKIGSLDVSVVGLGTNNLGSRIDEMRSRAVLDGAFDSGITFIDTADAYGQGMSESIVGKFLGKRRDEVVLATKFGNRVIDGKYSSRGGGKPEYVRAAIENSLRRLDTDRIDLYIYHRSDPETPLTDTLEELGSLVRSGKVIELGCSNFTLDELHSAEAIASEGGPRFVNLQNEFSLLHRSDESILFECALRGIGFVPYYPLAGGLLTGKYRKDAPLPDDGRITNMSSERRNEALSERNLDLVDALLKFVSSRDHSLLELAISWLLTRSGVASVITGATSKSQVEENIQAANWNLSSDDLAEIDRITLVD